MKEFIDYMTSIGGPNDDTDWGKISERFGFGSSRPKKAAQDCWRNWTRTKAGEDWLLSSGVEYSSKKEDKDGTESFTLTKYAITAEQQAKLHGIDLDLYETGPMQTNCWGVGIKLKVDGEEIVVTQPLHQLKVKWVRKKEKSADYQVLMNEMKRSLRPKSFSSRTPEPGEYRTHLVLPDVHRPYHNKFLWDAVLHLCSDIKMHGVAILGDFFDMASISSHNKGKEVRMTLWDEYLDGGLGIAELESAGGFMEKNYLVGNHEDRLYRYIKDLEVSKLGQAIIGIEQGLGLKGWNFLNNWKEDYIQLGGLQIIHGLRTGKQSLDRTLDDASKMGVDLMYGHTHWFMSKQDNRGAVWNIGTLADLSNLEGFGYVDRFARANWRNGFSTVTVDDQGRHFVHPVPCTDRNFFINGKKY